MDNRTTTFRRRFGAVSLLVAAVLFSVAEPLFPTEGDNPAGELAANAQHHGQLLAAIFCYLAASILFIPAFFGLMNPVRGRGTVLTHLGGGLALLGNALAGLALTGLQFVEYEASAPGIDRASLLKKIGHQFPDGDRVHYRTRKNVCPDEWTFLYDGDLKIPDLVPRQPSVDQVIVDLDLVLQMKCRRQIRRTSPDEYHIHLDLFPLDHRKNISQVRTTSRKRVGCCFNAECGVLNAEFVSRRWMIPHSERRIPRYRRTRPLTQVVQTRIAFSNSQHKELLPRPFR